MQRLIRSFNTLTDELRDQLQEQYPDGIDNSHIRTIATAKGDTLRVIELRTADAIYLIKINPESREEIEQFLDQDSDDDGGSDDIGGDTSDLETDDSDDSDDQDDDTNEDDGDDDADEDDADGGEEEEDED